MIVFAARNLTRLHCEVEMFNGEVDILTVTKCFVKDTRIHQMCNVFFRVREALGVPGRHFGVSRRDSEGYRGVVLSSICILRHSFGAPVALRCNVLFVGAGKVLSQQDLYMLLVDLRMTKMDIVNSKYLVEHDKNYIKVRLINMLSGLIYFISVFKQPLKVYLNYLVET